MDEKIHCHKCKKKTNNINPKIVQMSNGLDRIATKCKICKTNKSKIVLDAKKIGHKAPNLLHTDKGLEFKNKQFNAIMKKYNIKLYHTENEEKSSIIERYNRTQNERMKIYLELNKKWIDILPKIVKEYNDTVHTTTKMKPNEVNEKK